MAEANTDDRNETAEGAGKNTSDAQDNGKPDTAAKPGQVTFTDVQQAHIDNLIEDRLAKQRAQHEKKQKDLADAAEQKRLTEQGEFKALADQRQVRIIELEAELRNREVNTLRATVAARHKLPEHWIERLKGETETELDADAARIAKDIAPPKAPAGEGGERPQVLNKAQAQQRAIEEAKRSGRYAS